MTVTQNFFHFPLDLHKCPSMAEVTIVAPTSSKARLIFWAEGIGHWGERCFRTFTWI